MRDIILWIAIPLSLIWGLVSAPVSVIILNWICFQRPYDFSWGFWQTAPVFQLALAVTITSNFFRGNLRFRFPLLLVIYIIFLCSITISTFLAFSSERAWLTYKAFLPSMWVTPIVMFATIHDLQLLKWVIWVSAGGIGFNAFKTGLTMTVSGGGHLTDQISGFVGDNNVFGLVLCLVVAIILGLRESVPKKWWLQILFYISLIFIILCIIYTKSRGALLSLGITLFLASLLSGKPIRNLLLILLIVYVGYQFIPSDYFDRFSTLKNVEADESAMGRFENWELSWNEALNYPFFGVGPDNHIPYNKSIQSEVQVRVAHSVYFQILGELGFIGLGFYLWFVGLGLWTLFRTWRVMIPVAMNNPDLAWVRDVALWMTCAYVGYIFGSGFLNMLYIEFPWYVVFYGSMLWPLVNRELCRRKTSSLPTSTIKT